MRLLEPCTSSFDTISFSTACNMTAREGQPVLLTSMGQGLCAAVAVLLLATYQNHTILAFDAHCRAADTRTGVRTA
jgi:uncharacterized membrane protein